MNLNYMKSFDGLSYFLVTDIERRTWLYLIVLVKVIMFIHICIDYVGPRLLSPIIYIFGWHKVLITFYTKGNVHYKFCKME